MPRTGRGQTFSPGSERFEDGGDVERVPFRRRPDLAPIRLRARNCGMDSARGYSVRASWARSLSRPSTSSVSESLSGPSGSGTGTISSSSRSWTATTEIR